MSALKLPSRKPLANDQLPPAAAHRLDADLSGSISLDKLEAFVIWGEKAFHSWVSGGGMVALSAVTVASHGPGWQPPDRTT